jgi:uncharacterized protein
MISLRQGALVSGLVCLLAGVAHADNTAQVPPHSQAWTNIALINTTDDWAGVPGWIGYRGDALTAGTGVDPQTVLVDGTGTPVDVNVNQTNPNTFATGGVTEFHITDPVVALSGSGTARAPFLLVNLDLTGQSSVQVSYTLRDIDGSTDNAVQPIALHYRVGNTGTWTNLPSGFVADASIGPSTMQSFTRAAFLPVDANGQPLVQVRWMTTDAVGNDEWIGIDGITIASAPQGVGAATPNPVYDGQTTLLTVTVTPAVGPAPRPGSTCSPT